MEEQKKALVLTWETDQPRVFWNDYAKDVHPIIKDLHDRQIVEQVFPFEHKPLNYKGSKPHWTNCVVLMLKNPLLNDEIYSNLIAAIEKSSLSQNFRSLDLMKLQKGLDMFYSLKNGFVKEPKMQQTIEYVFSQPEARKQYYEDQDRFSGPAMQDLHRKDRAGRFIGFEMEKRIFGSENMPEWDVLHLIGFTNWQTIKAIPFFYSTWNKHARRAFGKGMTLRKRLAEWNKIRVNVKTSTKQNFSLTLRTKP